MAQKNNSLTQSVNTPSLIKRMLIGAAIALVLIILFLIGGHPDPSWQKFWMIRPLIVVPLAGAAGGACSYFIDNLLGQGPARRILAVILSLLVYTIGLWLGSVLGLAGTYWN